MKLGGQGGGGAVTRDWRRTDGYAMAALLVGMSIMAILMGAALPVWNKQAQREREEEYLFRAHQYARAVMKFRQRIANTNPPSVDVLVEQRFLRKKYKDPITGEDFQLVYQTAAAGIQPGGPGSATPGTIGPIGAPPPPTPGGPSAAGRGGTSTFGTGGTSSFGTGGTSTAGTGGTSTAGTGGTPTAGTGAPQPGAGIIGVVSKSKATSIKIYNGRTRYDQWAVTYQDVKPGKGLPPDILQALNMTAAAAAAAGAAPGRAPGGNPFGGGTGQQPGGMNPFAPGGGQKPFGSPGAPSPFGTPGGQNPFGGGGFGQPVPPPQPGGQPPPGAPPITPAYPPPPGFGAGGSLFGPPPKKG